MSGDHLPSLPLAVYSFGFRYCSPPRDDMRLAHIIDLRHLPRPWEHVDADSVRGTDAEFSQKLFENEKVAEFWERALEAVGTFVAFARECFLKAPEDRRGSLAPTIAFGCRSGRHRSVAFAERLLSQFKSQETTSDPRRIVVSVHHRDISRVPSAANAARKLNIKCAVCKVSVSTAKGWNEHIRSKSHRHKALGLKKQRKRKQGAALHLPRQTPQEQKAQTSSPADNNNNNNTNSVFEASLKDPTEPPTKRGTAAATSHVEREGEEEDRVGADSSS